jgi:hypothetical protein
MYMSESHEISKLTVDVNGIVDADMTGAIREIIPEIIEKYFDQHHSADQTVIIDRIHLNLGKIKRENLREELTVRLSYLLHSELEKFFQQPNIEVLLEEKNRLTKIEIFAQYLHTGFTKGDETVALSALFEQYLTTNLSHLSAIIAQAKSSQAALKRIFYQVKFESQEIYWTKLHPAVYREINAVNQQVLKDFGELLSMGHDIAGLQGILKTHTFNFMMGTLPTKGSGRLYFELLKSDIDAFVPYGHALDQGIFHYFETVLPELTDDPISIKPVRAINSFDTLLEYIESGQVMHTTDVRTVHERATTLTSAALSMLAANISFDIGTAAIHGQIRRLHEVLSAAQLIQVLKELSRSVSHKSATAIKGWLYLNTLTSAIFTQDIYQFGHVFMSGYLAPKSIGDKQKAKALDQYLKLIAAKSGKLTTEATKQLSQEIETSGHPDALALKRELKHLMEAEKASQAPRVDSKNDMGAYMHYLKSGIWIMRDATPDQVLGKLLADSPEHLSMQLSKLLNQQVPWLRMLYQHQMELLEEVFQLVFRDDPDLKMLLVHMEGVMSSAHKTLIQRKLLEIFVALKSEQHLGSGPSFELLFDQKITEYQLFKVGDGPDDATVGQETAGELLASWWTTQDFGQLDKSTRNRLVDDLIAAPHLALMHLMDQRIPHEKWQGLLASLAKPKLLTFLTTIAPYTIKSGWLRAFFGVLQEKDFAAIFSKSAVVEFMPYIVRGEDAQLKAMVKSHWQKFEKKSPAKAKVLLARDEVSAFVSHVLTLVPLTVNGGGNISDKEFLAIAGEFQTAFEDLKIAGVQLPFDGLWLVLNELLPLSKSGTSLKYEAVKDVYGNLPQYRREIHDVINKIFSKRQWEEVMHYLIADSMESGILEPAPFFDSTESFERALITLIEKKQLSIEVLAQTTTGLLEKVFEALTPATLAMLKAGFIAEAPAIKEWQPKSVSALLAQMIELEHIEVVPYFASVSEFETQLLALVRDGSPVLEVFNKANTHRLVKFLGHLSPALMKEFKVAIETKFEQSAYLTASKAVKTANEHDEDQLELVDIAYGLKVQTFRLPAYLKFVSNHISGIVIPVLEQQEDITYHKEQSYERYVHAFIHLIKHGKYIDLTLEQDGIPLAADKISTYWPDELVSQLSSTPNVSQVFERILDILPADKWTFFFNRMAPAYQGKLSYVLEAVLAGNEAPKKALMVSWLTTVIRNHAVLDVQQVVQLLKVELGIISLAKRETKKQVKPILVADLGADSMASLPIEFLNLGISVAQTAHFKVFDLVREVIHGGKFPYWSAIHTSADFLDLLLTMEKTTPVLLRKMLDEQLRHQAHTENLLSVLGSKSFITLFKRLDPVQSTEIAKVIDNLVKTHKQLGDKESLKTYFYTKYAVIRFSSTVHKEEMLVFRLLAEVPSDFGLSTTDYHSMLGDRADPIVEKYIQLTDAARQTATAPLDSREEIDLLLHLIVEDEVPWWANEKEINMPIDQKVDKLTARLLDQHPEVLLKLIATSGQSERIYKRILPTISLAQFERITLVLMPDFGGFIVSFNLLIFKRKKDFDKARWFLFVLQELANGRSFDARVFTLNAVTSLAELTKKDKEKLREELLKIAKDAIKGGEMRFLPFVDLLSKFIDSTEQVTAQSTLQEAKIAPSTPLDFKASVIHYMRTGSMPIGSLPMVRNYMDFAQKIQQQILLGFNELRLAIIENLKLEQVRARIIRHESAHFQFLLLDVLYPGKRQELVAYKRRIANLFRDQWPTTSAAAVGELFFQSLFKHALEKNFSKLTTGKLMAAFMARAKDVFGIEYSADTMQDLGIEQEAMAGLLEANGTPAEIKETPLAKDIPAIPIFDELPDKMLDQRVLVKNAGLVIIWPFLTRYFDMLSMTEKGQFKTNEEAVRAVHLLQYIATGSAVAPEHELLLNKVLCGVKLHTPVPMEIALTEQEKETTEMMLNGLLQNWEKLKSSSIEALREGFLMRDGYLLEKDKTWEIKVEKKTLDILMENLPWAFGTITLPWIEKRINVEWL